MKKIKIKKKKFSIMRIIIILKILKKKKKKKKILKLIKIFIEMAKKDQGCKTLDLYEIIKNLQEKELLGQYLKHIIKDLKNMRKKQEFQKLWL